MKFATSNKIVIKGSKNVGCYLLNTNFDSKKDQDRLNFGGIYAVTASSFTLTKLLTSSYDVIRIIHFKSAPVFTPGQGRPFINRGKFDQ